VETKAFALQAMVLNGKLPECLEITRWLLQQRNSKGGFASTQATVVGISALARFAEALKMQNQTSRTEMRVEIYLNSNNFSEKPLHSYYIGQSNLTTLQEFFLLPNNTQEVYFKASGVGVVLAQLQWSYYVDHKNYSGTD